MGYSALDAMRTMNRMKYGIDGPRVSPFLPSEKLSGNLEEQCLLFLRERCERLGFDRSDSVHQRLEDLDGMGTQPNQIPLYMERDLDRLCFENAIHRFFHSSSAANAFDIYFCYLEMFVGNYRQSKKMIELLSEFETNTSAMLMKHRDHYSHSVYVFLLGLAIYQEIKPFAEAYNRYYRLCDKDAPAHFLQYWGLTALFHDIGYPFELPFEQVKSYFGDTIKNVPFVSYRGLDPFISFQGNFERYQRLISTAPGFDFSPFEEKTLHAILAHNIAEKLGSTYEQYPEYQTLLRFGQVHSYEEYLEQEVLSRKPREPDHFGGFMDHAYFSAIVLMHKLVEVLPQEKLNPAYTDALTAIAMHNSLYKFAITNVKEKRNNFNASHHFDMHLHPLAYLLMLCDELQCWDRVSYGQNSRQQYHPMWCDLSFSGNTIHAVYDYDQAFHTKGRNSGTYRKMTTVQDGKPAFLKDIEDIIRINEPSCGIALTVEAHICEKKRSRGTYLSTSSFLHLYQFAVALNAQYSARNYDTKAWAELSQEEMEASFDRLSLEYKLSNIAQAKAFAKYLDEIDCFYTDRAVDYPMKRQFSLEELRKIGTLEHDRWDQEKESMGWIFGTTFLEKATELGVDKKQLRELTRTHNDLNVPFNTLSKQEQDKDTDPMNDLLKLLEEYDGLRVYSLR